MSRIVCSWCGKVKATLDDGMEFDSHGICEKCVSCFFGDGDTYANLMASFSDIKKVDCPAAGTTKSFRWAKIR